MATITLISDIASGFLEADFNQIKTLTNGLDDGSIASNNAKISYTDAAAVGLNTTHRTSTGANHTWLDQALLTTSSPTFAGLTVDTNTLYVDATNDRVGIGTTSPIDKLEVVNNNNSVIWPVVSRNKYHNTDIGYGTGIKFKLSSVDTTIEAYKWSGIAGVSESTYGSRSGLAFYTQQSTTSALPPVESMRISYDGKVGIGTTTPSSLLHTYTAISTPGSGEATGVGQIRIDNAAGSLSSAGGIEFKVAGDSNGFGSKIQAINSGGSQLVFANRHGTATWTERMRLSDAGNLTITGALSKGSGTFTIDHPLDPKNKLLQHSFVESPEMRNMYYGQADIINGKAIIVLPDWWEALNGTDKEEYNYQFTPIGEFANIFVSKEISNGEFEISADKDIKVSWQISAIRHDKFAEANRVIVEVDKEEPVEVDEIVEQEEKDEEGKIIKEAKTKKVINNKSQAKGFYRHPEVYKVKEKKEDLIGK